MKSTAQIKRRISLIKVTLVAFLVLSIQACATMDGPPAVEGPAKFEMKENVFIAIGIDKDGNIVDIQGNKSNKGIPTGKCRIKSKNYGKDNKKDTLKPCAALKGRNVVNVENFTTIVTRNSPPCLVVLRSGGDISYQYPDPCEE